MTFTQSTRTATRLARAICALAVLIFAVGAALYLTVEPFDGEAAFTIACVVVFAGVGSFLTEVTHPGELEYFPGYRNALGLDDPLLEVVKGARSCCCWAR